MNFNNKKAEPYAELGSGLDGIVGFYCFIFILSHLRLTFSVYVKLL